MFVVLLFVNHQPDTFGVYADRFEAELQAIAVEADFPDVLAAIYELPEHAINCNCGE